MPDPPREPITRLVRRLRRRSARDAGAGPWLRIGVKAAVLGGLLALYDPLNRGPARWSPEIPLDEHIPLVKQMVVPYVSVLALGPLTLLFLLVTSVRLARSMIISGILLLVAAYPFYVFAQTHMTRPEVTGDDVFAGLLRAVYGGDDAYNCFPSLHTGFSVIIAVHWLRYDRRAGGPVALWCALIIASTLLVRQHYIADMLAGLAVAALACWTALRVVGPPQLSERASSP
ncbi:MULTISPECIES: phosphatase PAP2 family protein [Actinomadura]|uniref:Phosphatase PAP2 family protein n=1 Tax=Actinomadura litoris TaxID=2678616 RepID=A0A7K1L7Y9_9ACTN|nr:MULTISPECIES: phosphatase PAP2 family protein [Actinomadura]MBT2210459.1 phosphatase PAP2 family protein [Actinomadura sp. NEAU-AAG7]MUN40550.1 phosphatase PAP2 family protein [Actinomadura litoris]